jgi:hypothetical protein
MATRAPRSQDLPGMEDRNLADLEEVAIEYAQLRDERMALTKQEVALKARTLALMQKYSRTTYRREGLEIERVTPDETVKVRVLKAGYAGDEDETDVPDEDDDAAHEAPDPVGDDDDDTRPVRRREPVETPTSVGFKRH